MNWGITTMWHHKTVVLRLLLSILLWSLPSNAQEETSLLVAQRSQSIQRQKGNLPQGKAIFQKQKTKKALLRYVKPPSSNLLYFEKGSDEAQLEIVTRQEIKQLYELLKISPRSDIQLRLASLYVEQARLIENRIYEKYHEDLELHKEGAGTRVPTLNLSIVKEYSQKAINLYSAYLQKHPRGKYAPDALFNLGFSYIQINQHHKGRQYYERLIKKYPKHTNIEDAFFHLGDYYFNQHQWKQARLYYDKASKYRSKFYSFSIYKISWCLYNEGRVSNAMKVLANLIKESKTQNQRKSIMFIDLSSEALKDLGSFYIYSKYKASNAYSYFYALTDSEDKTLSILRNVGFAYKDAGEYQNMRYIFNLILKFMPLDRFAFEYKHEIVQVYAYKGDRKIFNQELKEWVQNYGPKSRWAKKHRSQRELIKKSSELMELTIRNYAFVVHHSFLKTKKPYFQKQALLAYQLYTLVFSKSKFDSDIRFQYGELLFDVGNFSDAVKQYSIVVKNYPKSKNHPVATWNRVLALEKQLPNEKTVKASLKGKSGPVPFPKSVQAFEQAVKSYLKWYKKKPQVPQIIYTLANLHLEYRHYKTAIKYWMLLIQKFPSKKGYYAQSIHLVLDTYNLIKDFDSLKKVGVLFLKQPMIQKLPIAKEIQKILRQAQFKTAQDLAESKKYKQSAELYEKFYRGNTSSDLVVFAIYNAALNYRKAKEVQKSRELYNTLYNSPKLSKYPKIKKSVMQDMATIFQNSGQYLKAAQAYKNYAKSYPKDKNTKSYWYNAAIIFDGLNFYQSAEEAYMKYFSTSKGGVERNQVYFLIARMYERRRFYTKSIGWYQKYLNRPDTNKKAQVTSAFRLSQLSEKLRKTQDMEKWYRVTLNIYRKFKQGVEYASQARFYFSEKIYNKFINIRFPSNPNRQAQALQSKLKLLNRLKEDIKDVIRFNYNPQIISSLVLMGLANHHLYSLIINSPTPKGLDAKGRKTYKEGLAKTAESFKKVAQDYYHQAIGKSDSSLSDTSWLKKAQVEHLKLLENRSLSIQGSAFKVIPLGDLR